MGWPEGFSFPLILKFEGTWATLSPDSIPYHSVCLLEPKMLRLRYRKLFTNFPGSCVSVSFWPSFYLLGLGAMVGGGGVNEATNTHLCSPLTWPPAFMTKNTVIGEAQSSPGEAQWAIC